MSRLETQPASAGLSRRDRRKAVEQRLRLTWTLGGMRADRPAHKPLTSSLARAQPRARMPGVVDDAHIRFIGEMCALFRFVDDERARVLLFRRMQVDRGASRPGQTFEDLARELGITPRHADRLYRRALDAIADALDEGENP